MNKAFDFEKVTCLLLCLLFLTSICECLSFDSVIDCKLERKCQPYLEQRDQMCKNYTIGKAENVEFIFSTQMLTLESGILQFLF